MLLENNEEFLIDQVRRKSFFEMQKPHFHPYYEIYYLLSGKRKMFINHTLYTVDKGSVVIIDKGSLHRTTFITEGSHERVVLNFTDGFIKPLYEEFGRETITKCFENVHMAIPVSRRVYLEELIQKIKYEYEQRDVFSKTLIRNYLYELIIFLMRYQVYQKNSREEIDETSGKMQEIAKYICKNYESQLTLEEAAKQANMSATYFSKKFKKVTGFGFKEYLNNVRLKEAGHLLLETNKSITDIALMCGFADSNYFGDVFKKLKGISPSQYRKNKGVI
jgi:AraC-like DNA-binding protein